MESMTYYVSFQLSSYKTFNLIYNCSPNLLSFLTSNSFHESREFLEILNCTGSL